MLPKNLLIDFETLSLNSSITCETEIKEIKEIIEVKNIEVKNTEIKKTEIKKNKCTSCKKKVGLLGFDCQCGGNFCASHRHADQHDCKSLIDIIKKDREILAKQNIKVIADKLEKI
jgi:predicted nucleic acid binding AN1-type Zn finger protein